MRVSNPAVRGRLVVFVVMIVAAATMAPMLPVGSGGGAARGAVIGASFNEGDPLGPASTYPVNGGPSDGGVANVSIIEDVALDFSATQWLKDLVNATGSGFSSGQNRSISETLTNAGTLSWTGWHERVVSRTVIFGGPNENTPGFLFRSGSLSLSANYGAGFVPLTEGVDYTVTPVAGPPPGTGNGDNWEAFTINFAPTAVIDPGDVLQIRKDIFEVFGDSNVWVRDEAARIGEYPIGVPEPGAVTMLAIAGLASAAMRRGRPSQR